jgi:hypothetical protein
MPHNLKPPSATQVCNFWWSILNNEDKLNNLQEHKGLIQHLFDKQHIRTNTLLVPWFIVIIHRFLSLVLWSVKCCGSIIPNRGSHGRQQCMTKPMIQCPDITSSKFPNSSLHQRMCRPKPKQTKNELDNHHINEDSLIGPSAGSFPVASHFGSFPVASHFATLVGGHGLMEDDFGASCPGGWARFGWQRCSNRAKQHFAWPAKVIVHLSSGLVLLAYWCSSSVSSVKFRE